ncbi:MAG TPA: alpha-L-arabinofuranosidase C-terminal domain-containing protein [Tepidisphaeraceae bacterium]|nr:alpha-L-arabinofuranosidase C-terminal domain-containing protein [Tepidisphaeraceae bacterium]
MPARVTLHIDRPGPVINRNLYGHFAEHLGACVNDGLYVGEDSPIPNIGGLRSDLIEAFRRIDPPVLRWPGGCFADDYHWRDGVGPRDRRPVTVNTWWGNSLETNAFGTHEFITLCRLIGAEPYLAGNLGSGTVAEMRDWVEYCNFDRPSTLAKLRAANGSPMPFGVKYWGVGNEAWGCGGNFCPSDYAKEYRRYATYLRDFGGTPLHLIACGPDGNKPEWTRAFLKKLSTADKRFNCRIHALGAHYYCGTAGTATEYSVDQWYELLHRAAGVDQLLTDQRAAMDEFDPERRIDLVLDEWGTWHPPTPGASQLWQQNTVRDALVAAITLDTLNRRADIVHMANIAQAANVLQALFLTEGEKLVLTPTFHVFEMYKHHQGARGVPIEVESPVTSYVAGGEKRSFPTLAGSASVKGSALTLSLTNAHARHSVEASIALAGAGPRTAYESSVSTLTHDDLHAHNTFVAPTELAPRHERTTLPAPLRLALGPASVTVLRLSLS